MQLLCDYSDENETECLGVFKGVKVQQFNSAASGLKVPQIGWNTIYNLKSPLFAQLPEHSYCYFVHGYYAGIAGCTIASTDYGVTYSSGMQKDNFYGVQFHPEKSAEAGEQILKNFLSLPI
jgi:glutamine amidotransferase